MHPLSSPAPSAPRAPGRFLALATLLCIGACSSAPPVHVHTLMSAPAAARGAAAASAVGAPLGLVLEPIRLPAQVDQPQWLVRLPDDTLAVLEQERWASALRDELREALLEELVIGFGVIDSRSLPAGAGAVARVGIDVRRFDSLPGREARIEGSWTLTSADTRTPPVRCEWLIRDAAPGSMNALAAAHRRALVRLADSIGEALVKSRRGELPVCPARDAPL